MKTTPYNGPTPDGQSLFPAEQYRYEYREAVEDDKTGRYAPISEEGCEWVSDASQGVYYDDGICRQSVLVRLALNHSVNHSTKSMKYHIDITAYPCDGETPEKTLHRIAEKLREIAESIEDGCTQEQATFPNLSHYVSFDDQKEEA